MTDTRLKNCPFCGGEAEIHDIGNDLKKPRKTVIVCTQCHVKKVVAAIHNPLSWTRATAIEQWNRRTPPAAVPDGWAIVPCEPDDEMTDKGESALIAGPLEKEFKDAPSATWAAAKACYRAMISASPTPPVDERP